MMPRLAQTVPEAQPQIQCYLIEIARLALQHDGHEWPVPSSRTNPMPPIPKYVCSVCGYVYDPELGDPDAGIAPGTAFTDIPEDWICPVCGATKDQFELES